MIAGVCVPFRVTFPGKSASAGTIYPPPRTDDDRLSPVLVSNIKKWKLLRPKSDLEAQDRSSRANQVQF